MKTHKCFPVLAALLLGPVMVGGCSKHTPSGTSSSATSAASQASPKTADPAAPAAAAPAAPKAVTCHALIAQIIGLENAAKQVGVINEHNATKMEARCKKANNIKDNPEVVKCVMGAKNLKTMTNCKDFMKLLAPW